MCVIVETGKEYDYARSIVEKLAEHAPKSVNWRPCPDLMGLLRQIEIMVSKK